MAESPERGSVTDPGSSNPDSDLSFNGRVEIDTSTPFESVREAANRFGGFGFWRPSHSFKPPGAFQENVEGDIIRLKEQAAELQNDLIAKERETLEVVKELEATKATVNELNSKLQQKETLREEVDGCINPAGDVLKDLSKAKMNLCKRNVDLAGIRESVEVLNKQLQEEKDALEKTRERLMQKSLKGETGEKDAFGMMNEVQRVSREAQEVKKTGENARGEIVKAVAEIEETREKIKAAKERLVAARKMKEAARASEAVAIAEINAVTVSTEDAEEEARKRVEDAMSRVEEANVSKMGTLKKVDKAETSKKAMGEALERGDTANATKHQIEEASRNRQSEKGQRRRLSSSVNNTAKFKSRRETTATTPRTTRLMDVNGLHLTYDDVSVVGSSSSVPVLKPTMSIGQILSKKLLVAEDSDKMNVASEGKKMSLGQMLAKSSSGDETWSKKSEGKENGKRSLTRKRFAKIAMLLKKQSKDKKKNTKKIASNLR
ncbi:WEB family protein [Hirschfeldia incana]|nr:WEB family protein [Hirschfeldia incana]